MAADITDVVTAPVVIIMDIVAQGLVWPYAHATALFGLAPTGDGDSAAGFGSGDTGDKGPPPKEKDSINSRHYERSEVISAVTIEIASSFHSSQ